MGGLRWEGGGRINVRPPPPLGKLKKGFSTWGAFYSSNGVGGFFLNLEIDSDDLSYFESVQLYIYINVIQGAYNHNVFNLCSSKYEKEFINVVNQ